MQHAQHSQQLSCILHNYSVRGSKFCHGANEPYSRRVHPTGSCPVPNRATSNIEKGLSTRFLWIFPEPSYSKFPTLVPVNEEFSDALGKLGVHHFPYLECSNNAKVKIVINLSCSCSSIEDVVD